MRGSMWQKAENARRGDENDVMLDVEADIPP